MNVEVDWKQKFELEFNGLSQVETDMLSSYVMFSASRLKFFQRKFHLFISFIYLLVQRTITK